MCKEWTDGCSYKFPFFSIAWTVRKDVVYFPLPLMFQQCGTDLGTMPMLQFCLNFSSCAEIKQVKVD